MIITQPKKTAQASQNFEIILSITRISFMLYSPFLVPDLHTKTAKKPNDGADVWQRKNFNKNRGRGNASPVNS